jgi:hypothetical protein
MPEFPNEMALLGKKVAGYTVDMLLNADAECQWYQVHADNGDKAILYVYKSREERDASCPNVHGFRTSIDQEVQDAPHSRLFANLGDHRLMMPLHLRVLLTESDSRPSSIEDYTIERVLGYGFKGVTYEVRRTKGPHTPYALKLTIAEEYDGRTYLPEVDRMVDVAKRDRDHFPQIHACGPQ